MFSLKTAYVLLPFEGNAPCLILFFPEQSSCICCTSKAVNYLSYNLVIIFTTLIYWIIHILKCCKTIVSYSLSITEEGERKRETEAETEKKEEEEEKLESILLAGFNGLIKEYAL